MWVTRDCTARSPLEMEISVFVSVRSFSSSSAASRSEWRSTSRYASRHSAASASEQIRTMHQSSIKISYYLFDGIA